MIASAHVLSAVKVVVERYVSQHPAEANALAALRAQLLDDASILCRSNMRGHVTTSAFVLDRTLTRVLLIHHRALDVWLQPGGHYEPPGTLRESAMRELAEETGLRNAVPWPDADIEAPLDIDTHDIPARPDKGETAHRHHDFAYLAVADASAALAPQQDEVYAVRWAVLDEILGFRDPRSRRLAAKALALIRDRRWFG